MEVSSGDIVRSTAGRDKNLLFFVKNSEDGFVLLFDGRVRKVSNPKRKKLKHICFFSSQDSRVRDKIIAGESVTDAEVRKALKIQASQDNND